jgi:hypothetical protein
VTFAVRVRLPLVPVTVNAYVPTAVLLLVVMASVELPLPATVAGVNVPAAPLGRPATLMVTLLLKPFRAETEKA